jgi:hypothetical protein
MRVLSASGASYLVSMPFRVVFVRLASPSSLVVLCEPSQNGWFLERPHMQIQTDSCGGLISKGRLSDLELCASHEFKLSFDCVKGPEDCTEDCVCNQN